MDVYSYGVLLAECLSSERPYAGMDAMQIAFATVYRNKRPNLPSSIPQPLEKLVKVCWEADPKKRPPFSRILDSLRAIERTMERSSAGGAAVAAGSSASVVVGMPPATSRALNARQSSSTSGASSSDARHRTLCLSLAGGARRASMRRVVRQSVRRLRRAMIVSEATQRSASA